MSDFAVKFKWSRARALLIAVVLIVATNAIVLAGVAYNRSGEPEAVLQLTERELRLSNWSWPESDNGSIDMYLTWRVAPDKVAEPSGYAYGDLHWLQPAQLQELGFDVSGDLRSDEDAERIQRQSSRRVWLALEFDGPAYRATLDEARIRFERADSLARVNQGDEEFQRRLQSAQLALTKEEQYDSRLFVVDAALDPDALRTRYPDRNRYVILRGRIDVYIQSPEAQPRLAARVIEADVNAIRVPYQYRPIIEPLTHVPGERFYDPREPRFAATVQFGQRFEPWIVALEPLKSPQP